MDSGQNEQIDNRTMKTYEYGNPDAEIILIQPVDDHDLAVINSEISYIREMTTTDFQLLAVKVSQWNHDFSPWPAPAVLGNDDFGNGAAATLEEIGKLTGDPSKTYIIGGYSLAGLFALWSAYQTDCFSAVAAASPSVWFPDFLDYVRTRKIKADIVYLSLGDREEKTRNQVMASVGRCIRAGYEHLQDAGITCTLEWNPGNHFRDPDLRTAKAFAWTMEHLTR